MSAQAQETEPRPVAGVHARPTVSVLIPSYNEAAAIGECLERVLAQTYPVGQVIVADGGSTDGTVEIVQRVAAADARVTVVANEGRIQAAGLNEARSRATGEVLVRVDARSFLEPDYVERCIRAMQRSGAEVVGGRMAARPVDGPVARAIAMANGARWGAGPAQFHHSDRSGFVDTVYLGAFRRASVEEAGGWSVDVGVNEDAELNHRIRMQGGRIWYDASIAVAYEPRSTFAALRRQYVRYGWSRAATLRRHPGSLRLRQVAPAVLLPTLAVAVAGRGPAARVAQAALAAHVGLVAVGASSRRRERPSVRALGAAAALTMHWAWAVGFWKGLGSRGGGSLPPATRPVRSA